MKAKYYLNRGLLILKKHQPEIMVGLGIIGYFGSMYTSYNAGLKIVQVKEENKEILESFYKEKEEVYKNEETAKKLKVSPFVLYKPEDYERDLNYLKIQNQLRILKIYAPTVGLALLSTGLVIGGHNVLSQRNAALLGAYKIMEESFRKYRERIIDVYGTETNEFFKHGIDNDDKIKVLDPETKKESLAKDLINREELNPSTYAKWFDSSSLQFKKTRELNIFFLNSQELYANELLITKGHVFLNEIYDSLGIPRTKEGSIVGWFLDKNGYENTRISFGIYNPVNQENRDYINGYESDALLLDFNVDGVIYDLL